MMKVKHPRVTVTLVLHNNKKITVVNEDYGYFLSLYLLSFLSAFGKE